MQAGGACAVRVGLAQCGWGLRSAGGACAVRVGLAQCGCAAAIRAFLPPHSLLQLPSAPKAGGSSARCHSLRRLFLRSLRTQGRRSAAARRVPPTTPRSCRRVPPAAWPASPGGGADWALRQAPVQTARNQSHRGIGRQAGVTTPVKQVSLPPPASVTTPVKSMPLLES